MDQVAVLGVLQAEMRSIRGQRAEQEAAFVDAAESNRFGGAVHLASLGSVQRDVHGKALAVAQAGSHDPLRLRQPFAPPVANAFQECAGLAAAEWLHEPAAGLVAALVLKPDDSLAVECRCSVDHAHRVIGDLAMCARAGIPRVDLPDAGLVRGEDDSVGSVRGPLREERDRGTEALLPGLEAHLREANSRVA